MDNFPDDPHVACIGPSIIHANVIEYVVDNWSTMKEYVLIKHGADVNASERYNDHTPLHTATFGGYMEGVMLLVEHGANIYARSKCGDTPLYNAEVAGYTNIADYLRSR